MTCPIQPEPYFLAAPKIEESPRISFSLRNPQRERTYIRLLLNSSSSIIHYEEIHLVYGPLGSILQDQEILVKNKLNDTLSQLPTFFPSYETSQHTSVNPFTSYCHKNIDTKANDVFVLLHYLYFPSVFSEGITTNEIPTLPTKYQRYQRKKRNLNVKTQ